MPSLETFRVPGRGPQKDVSVQHHYWVKQTRLVHVLQQKPLEHCFTHLWPWSFLTKSRGLHKSVLAQNGLPTEKAALFQHSPAGRYPVLTELWNSQWGQVSFLLACSSPGVAKLAAIGISIQARVG